MLQRLREAILEAESRKQEYGVRWLVVKNNTQFFTVMDTYLERHEALVYYDTDNPSDTKPRKLGNDQQRGDSPSGTHQWQHNCS